MKILIALLFVVNVMAADYIGLDVRSAAELKANPAPGAVHITLRDVESKAGSLDKEKTIKVFCEAGGRAGRAKKILEKLGFSQVENIGSWREWNQLQKEEPKDRRDE